ncbi:MAG: hypothetical protein WBM78_18115 [Desulfobacterales bacterium]
MRLFVCLSILFFCSPQNGFSEESFSESWQSLETKYTAIHYHTVSDLYKFDRMIAYSPGQWVFPNPFRKPESKDRLQKIGQKIDTLYERVQEILDMRKWFKKVSINLYADKKELAAAYVELYRQPCQIRAWYAYEFNTIYVNVDDTHEEILAHEMAHAIIDHYLLVRPPAAAAEILARYVHTHIYD